MNRLVYISLVILPFVVSAIVIGIKNGSLEGIANIFSIIVIFYLPIIAIIRMKTLKAPLKEILLSFIPFFGTKYRFKRFLEKDD